MAAPKYARISDIQELTRRLNEIDSNVVEHLNRILGNQEFLRKLLQGTPDDPVPPVPPKPDEPPPVEPPPPPIIDWYVPHPLSWWEQRDDVALENIWNHFDAMTRKWYLDNTPTRHTYGMLAVYQHMRQDFAGGMRQVPPL